MDRDQRRQWEKDERERKKRELAQGKEEIRLRAIQVLL